MNHELMVIAAWYEYRDVEPHNLSIIRIDGSPPPPPCASMDLSKHGMGVEPLFCGFFGTAVFCGTTLLWCMLWCTSSGFRMDKTFDTSRMDRGRIFLSDTSCTDRSRIFLQAFWDSRRQPTATVVEVSVVVCEP